MATKSPRSEGTFLREVRPDDLDVHFEHQRDPASNAMAAFPPRDREAFDAHWKRILADPASLTWTIVHDGEVVGHFLSWVQDGKRQVGYWVGREHWGRGIATRALARFLEECPERPVWAHVAVHNVRSQRVLKKCGFTVFGRGHLPPGGDGVEELVLIRKD